MLPSMSVNRKVTVPLGSVGPSERMSSGRLAGAVQRQRHPHRSGRRRPRVACAQRNRARVVGYLQGLGQQVQRLLLRGARQPAFQER